MLQLGAGLEVATVVAWKEYATARAAFRARAQQRKADTSGWGKGLPPRPALPMGGGKGAGVGKGGGSSGGASGDGAVSSSPGEAKSSWMDVDWTVVRGKRARNEQSQ